MANEKSVKCRYCKKEIDKTNSYSKQQGFYYCSQECYKLSQSKKERLKIKVGTGDKFKPEKNSYRRNLTDYILELYLNNGYDKHNINWSLITAQIKNIQESNEKLQYKTILFILKYMVDILELDLFNEEYKGSIVTLVPYYYQEAKEFYERKKSIKEQSKNCVLSNKPIVITCSKTSTDKKFKEIDFDYD